jgi:hypothetical protein
MIFGAPIYGGAKLDKPIHYDFTLHDALLSYDIPGGVQGIPDKFQRIINYRLDDENFDPDWRKTKRNYYQLNGAVWSYYLRSRLFRLFPPNEIGNLMYDIGINKLPSGLTGESQMERLENYLWLYLEEYLEGPEGFNTTTRQRNSEISDEHLPEGYWESLIVPMPEKLQHINFANEWLNFKLSGKNFHKETHYYYTPLNNEFALSIEFLPYCNRSATRAGKYINSMHEKTMQMIMNSIRLEFA